MTDRRPIEGFPGCTITRNRRVFSALGREIVQTRRSGTVYVVIGSLKSGRRRCMNLDTLWDQAFNPAAVKQTMRPAQLHRVKRDAAWRAADGDLEINGLMDDLQQAVKQNKSRKRFSLVDAAEVWAAIGQNKEFREWVNDKETQGI